MWCWGDASGRRDARQWGDALFDPAAYEVRVMPLQDTEGGGWLATIPVLPGCMGDGETEMEAIEDVRLAALEWAEAALKDGDAIPVPVATRI
jgi:antitoxin HicB